jgi:uncharacterized protein YciI
MRTLLALALLFGVFFSSPAQETFTMQSGDSTVVMQKYFMVFLKSGPSRSQDSTERAGIQKAHLAHIDRMWREGHASIAGPFEDGGDLRGIVIFNTKTAEEAEALARQDPAVKAGRLVVEVIPWWAMKGACLR